MFLSNSPLNILKKLWKLILFSTLLLGILSVFVSLLFPLNYKAESQVLIISKSRYGVDPYTVIKSAERVGENISQIVETDDFYKKVMEQNNFNFDKDYFANLSDKKLRKMWQKTIDTSVVYGTGVLNIAVYHPDKNQAKELAGAISSALSSRGWEYVGGDVTIKTVNPAIIKSSLPAKPNLILNFFVGAVFGCLLVILLTLADYKKNI